MNFSFQLLQKHFPLYWRPSTLLDSSFLLARTVTDMSGNPFLRIDLIPAGGNSFSIQWNPFFSTVSDILQVVLYLCQCKHIFQSRRKSIAFYLEIFSASGNHYLNYREAYLKLLATIFFGFSDIPANTSSFHVQQKVFLNKFSIPASVNRFSVCLKRYSFIWIFFLLVETIGEIQFLKNNLIPASGN